MSRFEYRCSYFAYNCKIWNITITNIKWPLIFESVESQVNSINLPWSHCRWQIMSDINICAVTLRARCWLDNSLVSWQFKFGWGIRLDGDAGDLSIMREFLGCGRFAAGGEVFDLCDGVVLCGVGDCAFSSRIHLCWTNNKEINASVT